MLRLSGLVDCCGSFCGADGAQGTRRRAKLREPLCKIKVCPTSSSVVLLSEETNGTQNRRHGARLRSGRRYRRAEASRQAQRLQGEEACRHRLLGVELDAGLR